jgi:hypothetical protein
MFIQLILGHRIGLRENVKEWSDLMLFIKLPDDSE